MGPRRGPLATAFDFDNLADWDTHRTASTRGKSTLVCGYYRVKGANTCVFIQVNGGLTLRGAQRKTDGGVEAKRD
jgi:hypothetical protein